MHGKARKGKALKGMRIRIPDWDAGSATKDDSPCKFKSEEGRSVCTNNANAKNGSSLLFRIL